MGERVRMGGEVGERGAGGRVSPMRPHIIVLFSFNSLLSPPL